MTQLISVMLGGALGAVFRYLLSNWVYDVLGRGFPYGTLVVNALGSFLMGFLTFYMVEKINAEPVFRLFVLVGFLGAFTTFSTFSLETLNLINQGEIIKAAGNIISSVLVCLLAIWLGMISARQIWPV